MYSPLVDAVIAVHSVTRPIARAVASIVDHTKAQVRVSVVAHNIDPEIIRSNLGEYATHPAVRLLALEDGIHSPAGPMNAGLDHATARFVTVIGSDDTLAPGAVDSWLRLQAETGASTVLAKIRIGDRNDPYPPVRMGRRTRGLDAVKDRLLYRSAPLGLIDRERHPDLRFTVGLASGEDLAFSATLWFTGTAVAYDLFGPPYLVHEDAGDRVTLAPRSVEADFVFLDAIESQAWFASLRSAGRTALAVKILRVHFFDALLARIKSEEGIAAHREELRNVLARLAAWSPRSIALLSRADRRILAELEQEHPSTERILHLLDARWNYRTVDAALPNNPLLTLHRQAPLRTLWAGMRTMATGS